MLKITDGNATDFNKGIDINEADNVRIAHEINGARTLDFTYPDNDKAQQIRENKLVICEGQAYRIMKVAHESDGGSVLQVHCSHIFNADAPNIHIQNLPDMIGVNPYRVVEAAIAGTKFSLMTDSELAALSMRRVDYDGFKIDYFSTDKTNPYDVIKTVIESCGKGEIYVDNTKLALVERIGKDKGIRLDLSRNMRSLNVERDITDMVTRLYPYGKDDIHIGSVNGGVQYIQSGNAALYGIREGYRDFSDCTDPETLLRRAQWELDPSNEGRIDVPCINITGEYTEITKLAAYSGEKKLEIGDGVTVIDGGTEISERVVKIEYYPFSPESAVISVGRVKKDMFFYLEQMGALARRYKKASTYSGKVKASSVSGTIKNTGISMTNSDGSLSILSDLIRIYTNGIEKVCIGNSDGKFVCSIADNAGNSAISTQPDGKMNFKGNLTAEKITLGSNVISTDSEGNITVNGTAVRLGGEESE